MLLFSWLQFCSPFYSVCNPIHGMVPHPHIEDGPFLLSVASMERLTDTLRGMSTMCFQIKSTDNEIGHPSSLDRESYLL